MVFAIGEVVGSMLVHKAQHEPDGTSSFFVLLILSQRIILSLEFRFSASNMHSWSSFRARICFCTQDVVASRSFAQ